MRALRLAAHAVRATTLIDRAYRRFVSLRSRAVLATASDAFHDEYNDVSYASQKSYVAGTTVFRSNLFPWEDAAIKRHFPPPPATILVGAAGGGREAFVLESCGYRVVAFEPARTLAEAMATQRADAARVEVLLGRYEDLPFLLPLGSGGGPIDLRSRPPFDAALLGWISFSHLRSDDACVATLRGFGLVTSGPILVSYFSRVGGRGAAAGSAEFSIDLGYYRSMEEGQVARLAEEAGLSVIAGDHYLGWSILRRR